MTFYAHAFNARSEMDTLARFDDAATAADNLAVLMKANGWTGDHDETVRRLEAGETIHSQGVAYRVSDAIWPSPAFKAALHPECMHHDDDRWGVWDNENARWHVDNGTAYITVSRSEAAQKAAELNR